MGQTGIHLVPSIRSITGMSYLDYPDNSAMTRQSISFGHRIQRHDFNVLIISKPIEQELQPSNMNRRMASLYA
jgi:hypothetical protein